MNRIHRLKYLCLALCLALLMALMPAFADGTPPEGNDPQQGEGTVEPTTEPTPTPTVEPIAEPTAEPTPTPTSEPVAEPTAEPTPTPTPAAPAVTITGFAPLETATYTADAKPALADLLGRLPATVSANLSDGSSVSLAVSWACSDFDSRESGDFIFAASLSDAAWPLAEGVFMPRFVLKVAARSGEYAYTLNDDGEATITAWQGTATELFVPDALDGHSVVGIAAGAFENRAELTRVELPKGLKTVGDRAFAGCAALKSVSLPDSLESFGSEVFQDDAAIATVTLRAELASRLTAADSFERAVVVEETESVLRVQLPLAVTDIQVNAETFTLDCDALLQREHAVSIGPGGTLKVAAGRTFTMLGVVANAGRLVVEGAVVNCGGSLTGNAAECVETGVYTTEHRWENGRCALCGEPEPEIIKSIEILYVGPTLTKTYDKTRNVTLKASDFSVSAEGVTIDGIAAEFDSPGAGSRTVKVSFVLGGEQAAMYTTKDLSISARITPKTLTITPAEGQSKVYGARDPANLTGKVKGLLSGDEMSGRLSRESGENVGRYRIQQGTISAGDNYAIEVGEGYFTIQPKAISATDVGLTAIPNQRFTGSAVTPTISLHYGGQTLVQDTDFTVEFADNIQPGTATAKLKGIGNFAGERTATFRILNVASGIGYTGSSGGGYSGGGSGGSGSGGTPEGDAEGEEADEAPVGGENGELILDEANYGTVLFNAEGEPRAFTQMEEEVEPGQWKLTITSESQVDEETGETLYTEDEREMFDELHLRLTPHLVSTLVAKGYTDIVYELEYASLTIPLSTLPGEIALPGEEVPFRATESESVSATAETPEVEVDIVPQTMQVAYYDICIQSLVEQDFADQSDIVLDDYAMVTAPYRLRVFAESVVPEDDEEAVADTLAVLDQVQGLALRVLTLEELEAEPLDAVWAFVPDPEDDETMTLVATLTGPAQFIRDEDSFLYAEFTPSGDGLYAVLEPSADDSLGGGGDFAPAAVPVAVDTPADAE